MSRMPLSDCTHWSGLPESINQMPFDCYYSGYCRREPPRCTYEWTMKRWAETHCSVHLAVVRPGC